MANEFQVDVSVEKLTVEADELLKDVTEMLDKHAKLEDTVASQKQQIASLNDSLIKTSGTDAKSTDAVRAPLVDFRKAVAEQFAVQKEAREAVDRVRELRAELEAANEREQTLQRSVQEAEAARASVQAKLDAFASSENEAQLAAVKLASGQQQTIDTLKEQLEHTREQLAKAEQERAHEQQRARMRAAFGTQQPQRDAQRAENDYWKRHVQQLEQQHRLEVDKLKRKVQLLSGGGGGGGGRGKRSKKNYA